MTGPGPAMSGTDVPRAGKGLGYVIACYGTVTE
jgi:hypothetical protein